MQPPRVGRVLFLTLLGLVMSAVVASARAVTVHENTPKPGAPPGSYAICQSIRDDLVLFPIEYKAAIRECLGKLSFTLDYASSLNPAKRQEMCNCTMWIDYLQKNVVPRCIEPLGAGRIVTHSQFVNEIFSDCDDGSSNGLSGFSNTSTVATPAETATAPTSSIQEAAKSNSALKTVLISGVILCVVAGLLSFAYKRHQKHKKQRTSGSERAINDSEIVIGLPVSNSAFTYSAMALTPASEVHTMPKCHEISTATTINYLQSHQISASTRCSKECQLYTARLGLWDDPVIHAVRIPHDTIFFGPLLARGGFGEVYKGTYKGKTVAIKQLLPEKRKDLVQIDAFMGEIKLMSQLDHGRIIRFIGVAWNSLSDACAVVEYMENGDLRSVLTRWDGDEEQRPQGFDPDKIKIALHIAHALTYLHSLQPVVVHRDLKSKNILLNKEYDAKLTDFGVSRERADSTMTAGVGSSLWMAPEVMMGQRYDGSAL